MQRRRVDFRGGPASVLALGGGRGGTPVLLLHGFAGDLLTWQFVAAALAAARPVYAVDLPGHGQSTLDVGDGAVDGFALWLDRLLDALDVPRAHVVGHSMGGYVALCLARHAPRRVAGLSLISCAGLAPGFDRALLCRLPNLADADEAASCAARLFARRSPLVERTAQVLLAQAADPLRRAALARIIAASFPSATVPPVDWETVRGPVQVLWGARDGVIPPPPADRLPPGVALRLFDGAGHVPHGECPGPVATAVAAFLDEVDATTMEDDRPGRGPAAVREEA
ncbi:alpha/beta fold hydrolase [Azospirillum sp. A39]|uniref:alpha/beta fold hydrolase n=1 Tax=Azospirillum sp. A39 TaxID=3462279 RepID=UPI00404597FA